MSRELRNARGRFVSVDCPDPNCDGRLRKEDDHYRCDGLTHIGDGPLFACRVSFNPLYDQVPA